VGAFFIDLLPGCYHAIVDENSRPEAYTNNHVIKGDLSCAFVLVLDLSQSSLAAPAQCAAAASSPNSAATALKPPSNTSSACANSSSVIFSGINKRTMLS
jgi:hypothetical protein